MLRTNAIYRERFKRTAIRVIDGIVILGCLAEFARSFSATFVSNYLYALVFDVVAVAIVAAAAAASLLLSPRGDRGRILVVLEAVVCSAVLNGIALTLQLRGLFDASLYYASFVLVPAALAYVILRHKILDVAFILNWALFYGGTSVVVLVVVATLEYFVEQCVTRITHVEGALLQLGVIDSIVFRGRHEQEQALRHFVKTAQFYTAEDALMRDTADALIRCGFVHGPAIGDARLYPMMMADRLTGVVAVGERESGEAMPPDIDDAITRIVAAVAATLSAIETEELRKDLPISRTYTMIAPRNL